MREGTSDSESNGRGRNPKPPHSTEHSEAVNTIILGTTWAGARRRCGTCGEFDVVV